MKALFAKILSSLLVSVLSFNVLVACAPDEPEHTHEFSQSYFYDEQNHWKVCDCKEKFGVEAHLGGMADCTKKAVCEKCGAPYGELAAHEYTISRSDEKNHWIECVCGAKTNIGVHNRKNVSHSDTAHTYTCSCGYVSSPQEHVFDKVTHSNASKHWLECACGYRDDGKDHVLVDFICTDCGYKAPGWDHVHNFKILRCDSEGHWYECECKEADSKILHSGGKATCTALAECDICTVSYGEFADHDYSILRISEDGHHYECVCGSEEKEETHSFSDGVCKCEYRLPDEDHVHDFSVLKYNGKEHWYECNCKVSLSKEEHFGGNSDCDSLAVCEECGEEYGEISHGYNDGELTLPATDSTSGTITYTCTECGRIKNEIIEPGTRVYTRADLEAAIAEVAWAYYLKDEKVQYDSAALTAISNHYGGICRHTREVSPEYGTEDTTIYSVCTGYPTKVYLEAIDRHLWEEIYSPNGVLTVWFWAASDNQSEENFRDYFESAADPVTENDRDMALVRWIDYEKYIKDEFDEVVYALSLGTFDSSSLGDWYADGKLEFRKAEGEEEYSYFLDGEKITSDKAKELLLEYIAAKNKEGDYVNLRPGDIITEDTHSLIYVGNGYVLDCNGYKYDIESGVDDLEENGSIRKRRTVEDTLMKNASCDYIITRPLDFYTKDYDGDPGNDIIKYKGENVEITEATVSREQYPAIEIDRTVDITPYGTAEENGTLTYTVKISNKTNETNYKNWRKATNSKYIGEAYKDLEVTEVIPTGTEFVSASEGYTLENGVLSWCVDIGAGSSVSLSFTVRVVAEVGSTVTCDGGFVANIPSNSISNRVGQAKITDEGKDVLSEILRSPVESWGTEYGTGLDFAESIYGEMGIDLTLPGVSEIVENLFTPTYIEKILSMTVYYKDIDDPMVMYMPVAEVSDEYAVIAEMLVDRYYGGYRMFTADLEKFKEQGIANFNFPAELDKTVLEFRTDHLEVGDILVLATAKDRSNTGLTSDFASTRILIYAGNETFLEMTSEGTGAVISGESASAMMESVYKSTNDIFFLLRPSLVQDLSNDG